MSIKKHALPDEVSYAKKSKAYAEWSQANVEVGALADEFRSTVDPIVYPGITGTAAFEPRSRQLLVNPEFISPGCTPETFSIRGDGRLARVGRGAVLHEIAHSLFSKFPLERVGKLHENTQAVVIALEELRIEYNMMDTIGRSKKFGEAEYDIDLRAAGGFIVEHNLPSGMMTPVETSVALALTCGRLDAGTLSGPAAEPLFVMFEDHYGIDIVNAFRSLWLEYLGLTDVDFDSRIDIAKRWLDLLGEPSGDERGEGSAEGEGGEGEGEGEGNGNGEGEGEDGESKSSSKGMNGDDVRRAADEAYVVTETEIMRDVRDRRAEAMRAFLNSREARKVERAAKAEQAFGKGHGYGGGDGASERSRLFRAPTIPTSEEQRAMVTLAQRLDDVTYVDKHVTKVTSIIPPGRLSSRAAVQQQAQASRGMEITAAPWKQKRRKSVEKTPLTVGIIADVSGSMGSSVQSVSTAAWMLSEAVCRVNGRTSTVLMGNDAYGLIRPGERMKSIPRYNATGGFEAFRYAYDAVDGSLNLVSGRGARILFIATDACFVSSEHEKYAWKAMEECKRAGVQVFWLDYDGYSTGEYSWRNYENYGYGEVINLSGMDDISRARVIGNTVVTAFQKVKAI